MGYGAPRVNYVPKSKRTPAPVKEEVYTQLEIEVKAEEVPAEPEAVEETKEGAAEAPEDKGEKPVMIPTTFVKKKGAEDVNKYVKKGK